MKVLAGDDEGLTLLLMSTTGLFQLCCLSTFSEQINIPCIGAPELASKDVGAT